MLSRFPSRRLSLGVLALAISFIGSGLLLFFLLRDLDWFIIRQTSPLVAIGIFLLTALETVVYTLMVRAQIRGGGAVVTFWQTYLVLTSSLSINYLTPVKVGIPWRVYLYQRFIGVPLARGAALVTLEALAGMLIPAFLAVAGITILFPQLGLTAPLVLIGVLLAALGFALLVRVEALSARLETWAFGSRLKRILGFIQQVQTSLRSMPFVVVAITLLLVLLMLMIEAYRLWLLLGIFGSAPAPYLLLVVLAISLTAGNVSMLPLGLGVRDASLIFLLAHLGVSNEIALSAAVVQRLFSPGCPLLLGVISSNILGVSALRRTAPRELPLAEAQSQEAKDAP
ncbi:MAG: hypothetical protein BWY63_02640 [Chloroflexi bacterium ADurb.Bin360]|nr:MAG: hypothetical protein BWY63_02640 [Chloroflexi bacterium ADurb.Bin360]